MKKYRVLFFALLVSFTTLSWAQIPEEEEFDDGGSFPEYIPEGRTDVPDKEKFLNFSSVYGVQWAFYLYSQQETLEEEGSFRNWYTNPFKPHFDKDSFDYNIVKHSLVGNYYYLFYRSRGYTEKNAFFWSFMSSLAFEFTIETITEKPSYQDIYQTPVFGAVLGIGFEKASIYFHSLGTWYGTTLGYLINPMTLIPQFTRENKEVALVPIVNSKMSGLMATYRF